MPRLLCALLMVVAGCGGDAGQGGGTGDGGKVPGPEGNRPPDFLSTPPASVPEGQTYLYAAAAEDPDAELVQYRKVDGPEGLEVSRDTGAVFWVVPQRAAGSHTLVIEAADPHGAAVQQKVQIEVTRVNVAPRITSRAPIRATLGMPWSYAAKAEDDDGDVLTFRLRDASAGLQVDAATGRVTLQPQAPGVVRGVLEVSDPEGLTATEELSVAVPSGQDHVPPPASLTAPANGATVETVSEIRGSVSAPDLAGWLLEVCQPPGASSCLEIGRGVRDVPGGLLGSLDPGPLLDEPARLRLRSWDADLNETVVERDITIQSTRHPGLFGLEMTDVVTRVDRVRVELGRSYDSRTQRDGDFGPGWELSSNIGRAGEMMPAAIQLAAPKVMSSGYTRTPCGFNCPDIIGPPQRVSVTIGNTQWVFVFTPEQQSWVDRLSVRAKYAAPVGANITAIKEDGTAYYEGFLSAEPENGSITIRCWEQGDMLYEPPAFHVDVPGKNGRFTVDIARAGRIIRMTGTPDLGGAPPPSGPTLTRDGVVGSRGLMVKFERDGNGRITRMVDTVYGTEVLYHYDGQGLLVKVDYPKGKAATFEYVAGRLSRYTMPDGIGLTRIDYDLAGHAIRKVFPDGRILVFDYDDANRKVTARDARGAATVYGYDERGNLDLVVDPMGNRTEMSFDAQGRPLKVTDPMGRVSQYAYDAAGNQTLRSEPGRGVFRATYDADGLPVEVTDPLGRRFTMEKDGDSRPSTLRGPDGAALAQVTYDNEGRLASVTEGPGRTTRYRYDTEDRETRIEEVGGHALDVAWSADGLSAEAVDEDGERTSSVTTPEDELAEVSGTGTSVKYEHDFAGEFTGVESEAGKVRLNHNAGGEITGIDRDGQNVTARQYDAAGRVSLLRNADGSFERYRYNDADQVVSRTTAEGTRSYSWDAAGTMLSETDDRGQTVTYARDQAGRASEVVGAMGRKVSVTYDAQGRVATRTDVSGATTQFSYDPVSGLPARIAGACGAEEFAWDTRFMSPEVTDGSDVPLVSHRDASGVLMRYLNDTQGRLVQVLDPAGGMTRFTYDAEVNVAEILDAGAGRWQFGWSGSRLASITTPEGRITSHGEDGSTVRSDGSVVRWSGGEGGAVTTTYSDTLALGVALDDSGRVARTTSPADNVDYTWSGSHLASVRHGDGASARMEWDANGRLAVVEAKAPDGAIARLSYEYDSRDRVVALVDPAGGRTSYAYDEVGRIAMITRANGSTSSYRYTPSGEPQEILHTLSGGATLRYAYEYDGACRRTRETTPEGTTAFTYDLMGRLESVTGAGGTTRYSWDAVGNRVRVSAPDGETTYTFDRDGRVVSSNGPRGATRFAHDDRGNLMGASGPDGETRYEYDEADRLTAMVTPDGQRRTQRYDAQGHLVELATVGDAQGARRCLAAPSVGLSPYSGCIAFYGGGGPLRLTMMGPEGLAGDGGKDGARFSHLGALGSVAALSGGNGALLGQAAYDAFGATSSDTLPADFSYRFAGELARAGLVFLRSRWYSPALGTFTSADSADGDFHDPRSLHRYAYGFGDPVNRLDPNGTEPTIAGLLASISIGNNQRAQSDAASMAARCLSTKKIAKLAVEWGVKTMLSSILGSVANSLTPGLAALKEIAADKDLRKLLFCGGAGSWIPDAGFGNVRFQVDIGQCGLEPNNSQFEVCGGPAKVPLVAGWNTSGLDFLLGSSNQNEFGLPIELKGGPAFPHGGSRPKQLFRYCRYASRSPYKMMIYLFYKRLPSDIVFARRAVDCFNCWSRQSNELTSCIRHPKLGAMLVAMGKNARGRFRIKYPNPPSLCGPL